MAGTNLYTAISATCWVALAEAEGEDPSNLNFQPAMLAKCVGVPPTTATTFGVGCIMQRDNGAIYANTGTLAVPVWSLLDTAAGGGQASVQEQDEGVNLGATGTWDTQNFVGAGVTATRVGNTITVTVPGGANGGSVYSTGNAAGYAMLAGTSLTLTAFSSPSIIATGNTGETTMAGVAGLFGSGSDLVATGAYATAITNAATLYTQLKALTGTAIITPSAIESGNYGNGVGVFVPGVYTTAAAIGMTAANFITLDGAGDYVFVSTGGAITFGATDTMILKNGATASRIFWVANNAITTGSTDTLYGTFMSGPASAITIGSTNIIQGQLLSKATIVVDGTASTFSLGTATPGTLPQASVVTGTNATGPTFEVINTGTYTGVGVEQVLANALTTGVADLISIPAATTGIGLKVAATAGTLTTGRYFSANNAATEVFGVGTNGHLISTVSATPPTIAVSQQNGITAAAITAGGTDTCGIITTTGTNSAGGTSILQVTFGKTYTTAPKAVQLMPINAAAAKIATTSLLAPYISATSATTFDITLPSDAAAGATPSFNYVVIA